MTVHILKTDGDYWDEIANGKKPFEVRKDDRKPAYEKGDLVVLVCSGSGPQYGAKLLRRIGYIAREGRIPEGWCVFELLKSNTGDEVRAEMAMNETEVSS